MLTKPIVVAFSDCDGLGHVNHARYFTYMEEARADVFRLFNPSLALDKWNLIVASARCDYLGQVGYAETLSVDTWISRIGNSSLVIEHAIWNNKRDCVARGQAVMIAYDYETQSAIGLWPEVRTELESHSTPAEGAPNLR